MSHPLLLQDSEGFGAALLWILFIAIPVLGRLVGWVIQRISPKPDPSGSGSARTKARRAKPTQARRSTRELEADGQDLWRRLLRGETLTREEAPPRPAPPTASPPRPRPAVQEPQAPREVPSASSESAAMASHLPDAHPAGRLAPEPERVPLGARLGQPEAEMSVARPDDLTLELEPTVIAGLELVTTKSGAQGGTGRVGVGRDELARAIVWSEILGKPVSLREPSLPGTHF